MKHSSTYPSTRTVIKAHLVLSLKDSKSITTRRFENRIRDVLYQSALEEEINIIIGNVEKHHFHMFIQYKFSQDIHKIIENLKWVCSKKIIQEIYHSGIRFNEPTIWENGYFLVITNNIPDIVIVESCDISRKLKQFLF